MQVFDFLWNNLYSKSKVQEETLISSKIDIIKKGDIEIDKYNEIAITGTGKFYPGKYKQEKVTIKVVDITQDEAIINEFLLWKYYNNNPLFLKMKGVCLSYGKAYIVLENFLYTLETAIESRILNHENKLKITKQCLEVISYLQKEHQYILDIRPGVFSINEKMEIKLIDFGLLVNHQYLQNEELIINSHIKYAPPEYFNKALTSNTESINLINSSYDIWSFGCLLIDIFSRDSPLIQTNFTRDQIISGILNGTFPSIPKDINSLLNDIISRCLNTNFLNRISIDELSANLRVYINEFSENANSMNDDPDSIDESICQNPLLKDNYVYTTKIDKDINNVSKLINEQLQEKVQNLKKNISSYEEITTKKIEENYSSIINYLNKMKKTQLETLDKFKNRLLTNILMMQDYYSNAMEDIIDIQNKTAEIKLNITTLNKFSNQDKYSNLLSSIESGKEFIQTIIEKYSTDEKFSKIAFIYDQNQNAADMFLEYSNNVSSIYDNIYQQIQTLNLSTNDLRYELSKSIGLEEEIQKETEENVKILNEELSNQIYLKAQENSNIIIIYNHVAKTITHIKYEDSNFTRFNSKSYSLFDPINKCVYISGGLQDIKNKFSYDNSFCKLSFSLNSQSEYIFKKEELCSMSVPRISHTMIQLKANGNILVVISGYNTKSCEAYNSVLDIWKPLPDLPSICSNPACIDYGDYIYVYGGSNFDCVYRCDIVNSEEIKWETINFVVNQGRLRKGMGIAVIDNKMHLFGGFDDNNMYDTVYIIDNDKKDELLINFEPNLTMPSKCFFDSNIIQKENVFIFVDGMNNVTEFQYATQEFYYYA